MTRLLLSGRECGSNKVTSGKTFVFDPFLTLTLRHSGSSITSTPSPGVANSAEGTKYALRVLEGVVKGPCTHPVLARGRQPMPIMVIWPLALPLPYSPAVDMPMTLRAAYSSSGIGSYDYPGRI